MQDISLYGAWSSQLNSLYKEIIISDNDNYYSYGGLNTEHRPKSSPCFAIYPVKYLKKTNQCSYGRPVPESSPCFAICPINYPHKEK